MRLTTLSDDTDPWPVSGSDAVSLAAELSLAAWVLGGAPLPHYARHEIPVRVIRRDG